MSETSLVTDRSRDESATAVSPIELFFDLVYVLALTKLTYHLVHHLTLRGGLETLVLLLAVWIGWIHISWTTNYFDLDTRPMRLAVIGAMLGSFVLSITLPDAFGNRALPFAVALVCIQVGWTLVVRTVVGRENPLYAVFSRVMIWEVASGILLLAGGAVEGNGRLALWVAAVAVIYVAMWFGFPVPGLGRTQTSDYTISGGRMAHRCYLFIIIALGESIIATGSGMSILPGEPETITAFVVAFVGTVALWWLYFDRVEEDGVHAIGTVEDPGRLGLIAYTYFHIPMVAGIILVAAADETTLSHPNAAATVATTSLIVGGPVLFIIGNLLFTWAVRETAPRSRLVAILALVGVVPLATVSTALVLGTVTTLILIALVVWDVVSETFPARGVVQSEGDVAIE